MQLTRKQATDEVHWARRNIVSWIRRVFGEEPWPMQQRILRAISNRRNREVAWKSCHSVGKTFVASRALLWHGHAYYGYGLSTAPTNRQVREVLWADLYRAYAKAEARGCSLGGRLLKQKLEWSPDHYVMGFTASEHDDSKFQGFHAPSLELVIDEASGVSQRIMNAASTLLASEGACQLAIGNPTDPIGSFAKLFKKKRVVKFTTSAFDTPNFKKFGIVLEDMLDGTWEKKVQRPYPYPSLIIPDWVADRLETWGPDSPLWASRIMAQFPTTTGEKRLCELAWMERVFANWDLFDINAADELELGVDVGGGGAESVIYKRRGRLLQLFGVSRHRNTMATAAWIREAWIQTGARVVKIDDNGIGKGVADRLSELGVPIERMSLGAPREPDKFVSRRAEDMWDFRQACESGAIAIDPVDELILEQSIECRWDLTSPGGKIKVESKADMAKRGFKSPDRLDAAVYAMAAPRQLPNWFL